MRDEWIEAKLGDLICYSIGGIWGDDPGNSEIDVPVYRQTEFNDSGILTTPAEAYRSISKNQLNSRTLLYGDILIQKSAGTPTLPGRVVMVPDRKDEVATFSNFLNLLRPDETKCIPRFAFLCFWFKHHIGCAFEYQRGTNIKNLDLPNYLEEPIFLPPLNQQKRIVDLISSVDLYIESLQQQLESAQRSRNALLYELLTVGGEDWVRTNLGKEFEICKNGKNYKDGISSEGLPITRIQTIASGNIDLTKVGFGNLSVKDAEGFLLEEGDILFSHINSLPHVGKVALVQNNHLPLVHGMNLLRMRFTNLNDPSFMFYLMQSESMRNEIKSRAQVAVNQVSINISSIKTIRIVIPPLETQKEIASLIGAWDDLIEECENNLSSSRNLKMGLLSELLSGEHDIPSSYDKVMGAA